MSLIEAIRSRAPVQVNKEVEIESLHNAVAAIETAFPGFSKTSPATLSQAIGKLEFALLGWNWSRVNVGDVALVAHAAFSGEIDVGVELASFLERETEKTLNMSVLAAAAEAYMDSWERDHERTPWLSVLLRGKIEHLPPRWHHLFTSLRGLLDPRIAPELVARELATMGDPFGWLQTKGLASPHGGKLMREVHFKWLEALPPVKTEEQAEVIFGWIKPPSHPLIGHDQAAAAAEKLLSPWVAEMPASGYRQYLLDRILELFGDPRSSQQEFWPLVSPPCRRVMTKWLAGRSMDALLKVITRSTANHMWPARHHFWKGLYDRGLIDEAWVALSKSAFMDAEKMYAETGDITYRMSGRQTSSNRRETCLLIMRIGSRVVMEGSHDYRVHIFSENDSKAPLLYEPEYNAEALILPQNHPSTRSHDQYGQWMRWVRERLFR
ncbi:hypothetical protein GFM44_30915 [Rhizobium leguminosarum bv. viciae]|nr:hypothetical protein [Rhizobium leguminosarum bv. viciae]